MSNVMIDFIPAVIIVIAIAITIAFGYYVIKKKKESGGQTYQYDERQKLVRGNGFRISFMTVFLLNFIYGVFLYGLTKDIVSPQLVVIAIGFIGWIVYSIYCIFNDAYLQVGQNYSYGKWILLTTFLVVIYLIQAYFNRGQGFIYNGFATGFSMNLMLAFFFFVILVSIVIKAFLDKRGSAHEES